MTDEGFARVTMLLIRTLHTVAHGPDAGCLRGSLDGDAELVRCGEPTGGEDLPAVVGEDLESGVVYQDAQVFKCVYVDAARLATAADALRAAVKAEGELAVREGDASRAIERELEGAADAIDDDVVRWAGRVAVRVCAGALSACAKGTCSPRSCSSSGAGAIATTPSSQRVSTRGTVRQWIQSRLSGAESNGGSGRPIQPMRMVRPWGSVKVCGA